MFSFLNAYSLTSTLCVSENTSEVNNDVLQAQATIRLLVNQG